MSYQEKWTWTGRSDNGAFQWTNQDGVLIDGTPWTQVLEQEAIDKTRATYEASVLAEFILAAQSKGVNVAIQQVTVTAEMVKQAQTQSCYWTSGGLHQRCNYTLPFYMKIVGIVEFTSDQPWTGASLTAIALYILTYVAWKIILAVGIAWGIYAFLSHLLLHESSSEITETITKPDGTVITRTEKKTESGTDIMGIIVIGGLILVGVVVLPTLLGEWKKSRGKKK